MTSRPTVRSRVAVAAATAIAGAAFTVSGQLDRSDVHNDFGAVWFGARAIAHGINPYPLVGPGLTFDWFWHLNYPATALVTAIPFSFLPEFPASIVFVFVSVFLFAFAITNDGWDRVWMIPSSAFVVACRSAQWSPLLVAGFFLPWLSWIYVCKPTLAVTLIAKSEREYFKPALIGGAVLLVASFAILPTWFPDWMASVKASGGFTAPVSRLGGVFILLAALKWKRPEARLLLFLSLVPQTPGWYEALFPMLAAQSKREMQILSLVSSLGYLLQIPMLDSTNYISAQTTGRMMVAFCYLPAVILILRKPNVGLTSDWFAGLAGRSAGATRRANIAAVAE